jgi:hypothetical protein
MRASLFMFEFESVEEIDYSISTHRITSRKIEIDKGKGLLGDYHFPHISGHALSFKMFVDASVLGQTNYRHIGTTMKGKER